jgi:copper(I)-binding protein
MKAILLVTIAMALAAFSGAEVKVTDAWVRPTRPGTNATGAFMQIVAPKNSNLVEARSPIAGSVEFQNLVFRDGIMKLDSVPHLELTAGKVLELKPGGYCILLRDLKGEIRDGEQIPITLVFEFHGGGRESIEVQAIGRHPRRKVN